MYTDFGVSIPAVRVRYMFSVSIRCHFQGFNSRSAGKIHMRSFCTIFRFYVGFNSRSAGKIHMYIVHITSLEPKEFQFPQCG